MILFIASWKKIIEAAESADEAPAFELEEQKDRYVLHGLTPAFLQHGWQVSAESGKLKVVGETQSRTGDGRSFGYVRAKQFDESFELPSDADSAHVSATADEHELVVVIPRTQSPQYFSDANDGSVSKFSK